jgi:hypothetical protein
MDCARCFSAVFTASEPFDDLVQNRPPGGVTLLACAEASMESLKLYVREGDRPRAGDNGNQYHPSSGVH